MTYEESYLTLSLIEDNMTVRSVTIKLLVEIHFYIKRKD